MLVVLFVYLFNTDQNIQTQAWITLGSCANIRMYLFMSNLFSLNTTTTMTTAINYETCLTFQNLGQAITVEKWGVIC
jgi:hypothetical protein